MVISTNPTQLLGPNYPAQVVGAEAYTSGQNPTMNSRVTVTITNTGSNTIIVSGNSSMNKAGIIGPNASATNSALGIVADSEFWARSIGGASTATATVV
jgi:hypothetical protein